MRSPFDVPQSRLAPALLILRLAAGAVFVAHGAQKVFGFGLGGVSGAFGQMGVPFPEVLGPFVAFLELVGGALLLVGLITRVAAGLLAVDMIVAMLLVHAPAGFFLPKGIEFTLLLAAITLALVFMGPGEWSLDATIAHRTSGARALRDRR